MSTEYYDAGENYGVRFKKAGTTPVLVCFVHDGRPVERDEVPEEILGRVREELGDNI